MQALFLIAAGGAVGASLRFLAGLAAQKITGNSEVITGTVLANLAGCLFAGAVLGLTLDIADESSPEILFFSVGLLGSLSTFSTFILELLTLAKKKLFIQLAVYLFLQIVVALSFTAAGLMLYKLLQGCIL